MMCLLWGQTEFAGATVKVRNGYCPKTSWAILGTGLACWAFLGQDLTGSKKQYGKDRQNKWTLSEF